MGDDEKTPLKLAFDSKVRVCVWRVKSQEVV